MRISTRENCADALQTPGQSPRTRECAGISSESVHPANRPQARPGPIAPAARALAVAAGARRWLQIACAVSRVGLFPGWVKSDPVTPIELRRARAATHD